METCKDCLHIEVCAYCVNDLPICDSFKDRSRFVELPCKVADTLYDIYEAVGNGHSKIQEYPVKEIKIALDKRGVFRLIVENIVFPLSDFGKTVFLSREEAEKALAERSKNER